MAKIWYILNGPTLIMEFLGEGQWGPVGASGGHPLDPSKSPKRHQCQMGPPSKSF